MPTTVWCKKEKQQTTFFKKVACRWKPPTGYTLSMALSSHRCYI